MKMLNKVLCASLAATIALSSLVGCASKAEADPDFSGIKNVAKLASLECYYHNVVKHQKAADGFLFGLGNIGAKDMWFEYDGIVQMGLNAERVSISAPSPDGVVTVTIPEVEILGHPDIVTESMSSPIIKTGWFTSISAEEKSTALAEAQEKLLNEAKNDVQSKAQATKRAKDLLEQYVKNIGEAIGKTYTVEWAQAESAD